MTHHKKAWLGAAAGLATVSLVAASLAVGASNEDETAYSVATSAASLTLGDTVTVTVAARGLRGVQAYDLALAYDEEQLAYVDDSASAPAGGKTFGIAAEGRVHVVHTALAGAAPLSGEAVLATATFRTLKPGRAAVEASSFEAVTTDDGSTTESALGAATVEVAAKPAPVAAEEPRIGGSPRVGAVLTAEPTSWDVPGTTASYEWQRDGVPIDGAGDPSYRLVPADVGTRLSLRVSGVKEGHELGSATSAPTEAVVPAATWMAAKAKRSVRRGAKVTVRLRVAASGVTPTGTAAVTYRGKTRRVGLKPTGTTTVKFTVKKRGRTKIRVTYKPAAGFAPSSKTLRLRVR